MSSNTTSPNAYLYRYDAENRERLRAFVPALQKKFNCRVLLLPADCMMSCMLVKDCDPIALGMAYFEHELMDVKMDECEVTTFQNWWHIIRADGEELKQICFLVVPDKSLYWAWFGDRNIDNVIEKNQWRKIA